MISLLGQPTVHFLFLGIEVMGIEQLGFCRFPCQYWESAGWAAAGGQLEAMIGTGNEKNGPKWSEMAENYLKWSEINPFLVEKGPFCAARNG